MHASMNSGISQLQPRSRPVTSALFIAWSAMHGNSDPVSLTLHNEVEVLLQHGLLELNDREREVLAGRYGLHDREPETLEVLAERLGLTRERIRQIQQEALLKLKRRMARSGINRESLF